MIIAQEASVKIYRIGVVSSFFSAIPAKIGDSIDLDSAPIQADFDITTTGPNRFSIMLTIKSNASSKPKPGYTFEVVALGEFVISEEGELKDKLLLFSALPMLVNFVRTFLLTTSSKSMHGAYHMPVLDMN